MAHMQKETYNGKFYEVEMQRDGVWFIPADVCGTLPNIDPDTMYGEPDSDDDGSWAKACAMVAPYVGMSRVVSITLRDGTLYRLSAPGYLDCTDWTTNADDFDDDEF